MLFSYRYVEHDIEKFQTWLDHLVKEVWCRNGGDYTLDLLHPDLKAVVLEIADDIRITTDHLDGPIKTIDAFFQNQLDASQRDQVSIWYDHNNDIEALCGNDAHKTPGTYADIRGISVDLEMELKTFCKKLFTDILHLSAVKRRLNTSIDDHYNDFVKVNRQGKCPYCGLFNLDGEHDSTRDAYDHFFPKSIYPFNSANFRNLAPMCGKCNSGYKLQKDPGCHLDPIKRKRDSTRRRAFYSYSATDSGIEVSMAINAKNSQEIKPEEITLWLTATGNEEEIESWNEVFGIEQRYKARCCEENDGKYWLIQAIDECQNEGKTPMEIIQKIERIAVSKPWAETNFLKKPFLVACKEANII